MQRAAKLVHAPRFHVAFIVAFRGGHGVVPDADGVEDVHVHGDTELVRVQEGMPHVEGEGFFKEIPGHGVPLHKRLYVRLDFTQVQRHGVHRRFGFGQTALVVVRAVAQGREHALVPGLRVFEARQALVHPSDVDRAGDGGGADADKDGDKQRYDNRLDILHDQILSACSIHSWQLPRPPGAGR